MTDIGVQIRRESGVGRITLDRPKALNALTLDMVRAMTRALADWAADAAVKIVVIDGAGPRGLCAGGDVRALVESGRRRDGMAESFWREEYELNAAIRRYAKPYIAVMDGIVMGGGVGVSAHGSHRIVTERTVMAMPEVSIGVLPDVGGTWLLSRAPGECGTYLALTGAHIDGADAIHAGLADWFVPSALLPDLLAALTAQPYGADPAAEAEAVIRAHAQAPAPAPLAVLEPSLDALFGFDTVEDCVTALRRQGTEWAAATLREIAGKSPTSLKVTLAALRKARDLDRLEACLDMEFRIICRMLDGHDFSEGVRAALIDKDRRPRWSPATLDGVSAAEVARHFAPLSEGRPDVFGGDGVRAPPAPAGA